MERIKISEIKGTFSVRKLNPAYVEFLKNEFVSHGFKNTSPVAITDNGILWDGNHRLEAAKLAGLAEIPAVIETPENMQQLLYLQKAYSAT